MDDPGGNARMNRPTNAVAVLCRRMGLRAPTIRATPRDTGSEPHATQRMRLAVVTVILVCTGILTLTLPTRLAPQSPQASVVIETTRELDPQTPLELMAAVQNLLNVGAGDVAREYFLKLTKEPAGEAQLAQLYDQLGPAACFQLGRETALAPEGALFAKRVIAAANARARDPELLQQQLAFISGVDPDRRIPALHRLAAGREQAAVVLLKELANPDSSLDKPRLRAAWRYLDVSAEEPVVAALHAGDGPLLLESLTALAVLKSPATVPHLAVVALQSQDPILRNMAIQALRRSVDGTAAIPDIDNLESFVAEQITQRLSWTARAQQQERNVVYVWTWSPSARTAQSREVGARAGELVEANRLCFGLARAKPTHAQMYLVTELALLQHFGRGKNGQAQWTDLNARHGSTIRAPALAAALGWSLEHNVPEAAISACAMLPIANATQTEIRGFEGLGELSRALRSSNRQVREAAALALMQLNPSEPFSGAGDLLQVALRMSTTVGNRRALVVHPIASQAEQLAGLLATAGWTPSTANSGDVALRQLLRSEDFELIMLSDELFRPSYSELLQQLKGDHHTQQIPLILINGDDNPRALDELQLRWNVPAFPIPTDEVGLAQVLRRIENASGVKSASNAKRIARAKTVLQWLAQIANPSSGRSFYELSRYDDRVVLALNNPELSSEAAEVLRKLGTARAKIALRDARR